MDEDGPTSGEYSEFSPLDTIEVQVDGSKPDMSARTRSGKITGVPRDNSFVYFDP